MKKINVKFIAESAIIAALYAAITWLLAPISYGPIQFRISEVLVLLVVLNPKYSFALIIGCFISNTTSSLGWYDMVFGTLATTLAIIPMCFIRKMPIAAIFPVISNGFIVSLELGLAFGLWNEAFWYDVFTVALGEAVVLYLLGIPLMSAITKNEALCGYMELDKDKALSINFLNGYSILAVCHTVLSIILYFAYPMYSITTLEEENEVTINYTMFELTKGGAYWLITSTILGLSYGLISIFLKNKPKLVLGLIIAILFIPLHIALGILFKNSLTSFYYYLYFIFPIFMILLSVSTYRNSIINIESKKEALAE